MFPRNMWPCVHIKNTVRFSQCTALHCMAVLGHNIVDIGHNFSQQTLQICFSGTNTKHTLYKGKTSDWTLYFLANFVNALSSGQKKENINKRIIFGENLWTEIYQELNVSLKIRFFRIQNSFERTKRFSANFVNPCNRCSKK